MSWDRRFGKMEGLPNGRIGETPRHSGNGAKSPGTSPKVKYDGVEQRVAMRVVIERIVESGPVGVSPISKVRTVRRSTPLKAENKPTAPAPKGRNA